MPTIQQVNNAAAGSQPGLLPVIHHEIRADANHYSKGRKAAIRYIVLHNTEGEDSRRWLSTNPSTEVSIHALIDRKGERWNLVDYADSANHVGQAKAQYKNSNCLGVEYENTSNGAGPEEGYSDAQLNTGAHLVAGWMFSYGIPWERVVRHGDIALPAGRRHDPSNFPMARFKALVEAWLVFFRALPPVEHSRYII